MTYRELLNKCKEKPGWFKPMEFSENEFNIRYKNWIISLTDERQGSEK